MTARFIGIAGGSGSGKSTLAIALVKSNPERFALIHLDDYFKKADDAPKEDGKVFWDHPGALRFDDLYNDLLNLKEGKAVTVMTRSELYNPGYKKELKNKLEYRIEPKPVIIVEGYLALYDERIRSLFDASVYLDFPIEQSLVRRTKFTDKEYFKNQLIPAHRQFVEPTKAHATHIITIEGKTTEEVFEEAQKHLDSVGL